MDSSRFGMRIYRAVLDSEEIAGLPLTLKSVRPELLVLRVPAGQAATVQAILGTTYKVRYADALVYYRTDLKAGLGCGEKVRLTEFKLSPATHAMAREIEELSVRIFTNYRSHYSTEPRFPAAAIAAGYGEWAVRLLQSDTARMIVAARHARLIGFLAWDIDPDDRSAEIVLNGVEPASARIGIYSAMLEAAMAQMREDGIGGVEVSTQLHNIKVQRVWSKHGFTIDRAFDTLHVLQVT